MSYKRISLNFVFTGRYPFLMYCLLDSKLLAHRLVCVRRQSWIKSFASVSFSLIATVSLLVMKLLCWFVLDWLKYRRKFEYICVYVYTHCLKFTNNKKNLLFSHPQHTVTRVYTIVSLYHNRSFNYYFRNI